jgi:hypothetical protein
MSQETEHQFLYCGRWVEKDTFRAFVYNKEGKKLAKSYPEFKSLICSGLWQEKPWVEPEPEPVQNFTEQEIEESLSLDVTKNVVNHDKKSLQEPEQSIQAEIVSIKPKRGRNGAANRNS